MMFITSLLFSAHAETPEGWFLAGGDRTSYEAEVVSEAYSGKGSAKYSSVGKPKSFGTLMQTMSASKYLGKRVRMSAMVKSEDIEDWAGLWMRVDAKDGSGHLSFDNMRDRRIEGTTSWNRYEIVLDVPEESGAIAFGILVDGRGSVWLDDLAFDIVDPDSPTTDQADMMPTKPVNPSFEE